MWDTRADSCSLAEGGIRPFNVHRCWGLDVKHCRAVQDGPVHAWDLGAAFCRGLRSGQRMLHSSVLAAHPP